MNHIERLFRSHYAAMVRLAVMMLRNGDAARDIVHDVFAALMQRPDDDGVTAGYLMGAVRNRCLNYRRHLLNTERFKAFYSPDSGPTWPDDETMALIQSVIDRDLGATCRRVVALRFGQGQSYRQIADELGISEVAVYKHLRHAIEVIRLKIARDDG